MTGQLTRTAPPTTGLIPNQRTGSEDPAPTGPIPGHAFTFTATVRRALAVAIGMRSLRPVPALPQQPYGETDGQ